MKILTPISASSGLDVASTSVDAIKLGSENTENSDISVDNLTVWANADFKNNVILGSSAVDNTVVNSKLTASNGLYVSGNLYVNGVNITASSAGNGTGSSGSGISEQEVSGALSIYAKSSDVSSSFVSPAEVTSALNPYLSINSASASFAELSDLSIYATLTGVSSSFTTPTQVTNSISNLPSRTEVTSALGTYLTITAASASFAELTDLAPYALSSDVSSSFVTPSQVTNSISNFPTRAEVTGTINVLTSSLSSSYARLAAANIFTANQIISGTLRVTSSVSSSQVTGAFSGSGALINSLTSSNINNFSVDVRKQISATSPITFNTSSGVVATTLQDGIIVYNGASSLGTVRALLFDGVSMAPTLNGANTASISITNANASTPGLVSIGAQTFAGDKTFSNSTTFNGVSTTVNGNIYLNGATTIGDTLNDPIYINASYAYIPNTLTFGASSIFTLDNTNKLITVNGALTTNGNVTLGDAAADTITVNGALVANANVTLGDAAADVITVNGALVANGNVTLGDVAGDNITINASTMTLGTNLNIDSNTLFIDGVNNRIGLGTNSPTVRLEISGTSGQFPTAFKINPTVDATNGSTRTAILIDNWLIAQDSNGNGTKDYFLRDQVNARTAFLIATNGNTSLSPQAGSVGVGTFNPAYKLDVSGSGRFTSTLTVSGGIAFPAAQAASSDPNTLDDYEEGTWTPALSASTTSAGWTYTSANTVGNYTKIGNLVHVYGSILLSSTGSSVGNITITGLPFTSKNTTSYNNAGYIGYYANLASGITTQPICYLAPNASSVQLFKSAAQTATNLLVTDLTNTTNLIFALNYTTA